MPPLRILQVIEFFTPRMGGSVQVAYQTARHLAKRGHQVTLCSSDFGKGDPPFPDTPFEVLRFHSVLSRWGFYLTPRLVPWAWRHLRDYDLVHLHNARTFQNLVIGNLAHHFGIPYFISAHGSLPVMVERQTAKRVYDWLFGKRLVENAKYVIAVSSAEIEQYLQAGVPEEKVVLVLNGLDLEEFSDLAPRGSFRKELGIRGDAKIITYLGRLHKRKGINYLIEAFADLNGKFSDANLIIAGPDDGELKVLKRLVHQLQVDDRVYFVGPLYGKKKLAALADSDVLASPAIHEVFGLVPFEALMCGCPVVVTDDCGSGELIAKMNAGYVIPYGDKTKLTESLVSSLSRTADNNQMVASAQDFIKRNLSWRAAVEELERIYLHSMQIIDQPKYA